MEKTRSLKQESPWLNSTEAREYARIGTHQFWELVHAGKIKSYQPASSRYRFRKDDIDEYILSTLVDTSAEEGERNE